MEHFKYLSVLDLETQNNSVGDLILFDRGYPSLFYIFFLQTKNKHFIMRSQKRFLTEVDDVVANGARDIILTISAFKK